MFSIHTSTLVDIGKLKTHNTHTFTTTANNINGVNRKQIIINLKEKKENEK